MAGKPLAVRGVHICNKMIPKWKARVNYSLWRPGSERNKTGAGAQHTLASTEDTDPGGQQGWPAQRHCTPRGPTRGTGSREAGEEGSSDLQRRRHQCRGNDRWRCEQESRGTPQEKGVCNHIVISYPRASQTAQWERICLSRQETQVKSLGREDPLEKETATHSSIRDWEIPRTEEPGGLQSLGLQKSDTA